ncbi:uncharacterized protein [Argopecten irradians]|uniref:uncharacterized protein n=1 Tax=Argopecten irradians TaxID=31199 RepID=UPI003723779F
MDPLPSVGLKTRMRFAMSGGGLNLRAAIASIPVNDSRPTRIPSPPSYPSPAPTSPPPSRSNPNPTDTFQTPNRRLTRASCCQPNNTNITTGDRFTSLSPPTPSTPKRKQDSSSPSPNNTPRKSRRGLSVKPLRTPNKTRTANLPRSPPSYAEAVTKSPSNNCHPNTPN